MKPPVDDPVEMERILRATPLEGVQALSDSLIDPMRGPHRAAVTLALDEKAPPANVERARQVVSRAGALAVAPMIEHDVPPRSARVFALRAMVAASLALRERVLRKAEAALDDKEVIPLGTLPRAEEAPKIRRVCDVALFELRRLRHLGEDEGAQNLDERAYLSKPFEERDEILQKLRREGRVRWQRSEGSGGE